MWTDEEICRHFAQALDPCFELQRFSELTLRSKKELRAMLEGRGFIVPKYERKQRLSDERLARLRKQADEDRSRREMEAQKNPITKAREARGLSQKDLAEALGVSCATVSAWEHGRYEPKWDKLAAVLPELREVIE